MNDIWPLNKSSGQCGIKITFMYLKGTIIFQVEWLIAQCFLFAEHSKPKSQLKRLKYGAENNQYLNYLYILI